MNVVRLEGRNPGPLNMERDAGLFVRSESGLAAGRVYQWDGPWVSLGRSQRAERALKPGCTVPWVQRPTGGKAVLHGHDVTIGLAVPFRDLGLGRDDSRSLAAVYRRVVGLLVRALIDCGVDVALGEDTRFVRAEGHTADCFAHVSPNDIVHPKTGQKTCGCALRVGQGSVLVQASVPAGRPLVDPSDVFANPSATSWVSIDPDALAGALESCLSGTVARRG